MYFVKSTFNEHAKSALILLMLCDYILISECSTKRQLMGCNSAMPTTALDAQAALILAQARYDAIAKPPGRLPARKNTDLTLRKWANAPTFLATE